MITSLLLIALVATMALLVAVAVDESVFSAS